MFAALLDPTTLPEEESRADQFALDLIEQLVPTSQVSPQAMATTRLTMAALPLAFAADPDFKDYPEIAAQSVARKIRRRLLKQSAAEPYLAPVLDVLERIDLAEDDDEVIRAQLPIVCAEMRRPRGTRIDPATIPIPLIHLYFMLICARHEVDNHSGHEHPRLKKRAQCPVCVLAGEAIELATRSTEQIRRGEWQSVAQSMLQLGIALATLLDQMNEYSFVLGAEWSSRGVKAYRARSEKHREAIEWREARVAELVQLRPSMSMESVFAMVAKEGADFCACDEGEKCTCGFKCTSSAVKKQHRKFLEKK